MKSRDISLETIIIKRTGNPEYGYEDEDDLLMDTLIHIDDVGRCMRSIASYIEDIGDYHDWSKIAYFDDFKKDTLERLETPEFKKRDWYKIHTYKERHHINARTPDNVDLFDVLEMMVDCIVAGKSRTGSVNELFLILNEDVLENAYWNTFKLLSEKIVVEDE